MGLLDRAQQELSRAQHESSYSVASEQNYQYAVLQVTLKEKLVGTGTGNLTELENVINRQARDTACTPVRRRTAAARVLAAETASRRRSFSRRSCSGWRVVSAGQDGR